MQPDSGSSQPTSEGGLQHKLQQQKTQLWRQPDTLAASLGNGHGSGKGTRLGHPTNSFFLLLVHFWSVSSALARALQIFEELGVPGVSLALAPRVHTTPPLPLPPGIGWGSGQDQGARMHTQG